MSKMLDAFIQQTYGSAEQAHAADKKANEKELAAKELAKDFHKRAVLEMYKDQSIAAHMAIPAKLKPEDLKETPKPHPQFASYDHSLEVDRTAVVRQKYLAQKYKDNPADQPALSDFKVKETETGSVEEMFNELPHH